MQNGLTLYNITNDFVDLMDKAQEGTITEEEYNKLGEELALELQKKSGNIVGYIQDRNALIDAIDSQIKRLQDYKKQNMERLNILKIETDTGTLSIAKSPISVEVVDEEKIPDEYKDVVFTTKVNKKKIADNFKATGELVEGVEIHADNTNLRVK